MILGIDLGTTYSLAAWMSPEGPRLIPNVLGEVLTPSAVGVDLDGHWLVGRAAKELQVTHPERVAAVFKRQMGSEWRCTLGGHSLSAVELSARVLQSLKGDAEAFLNTQVEKAVITVPAYFNEPQRRATMQAGRLAGLEVVRIINEPTAAAIAYGVHESAKDAIVLVFDLGGGTFDVSIVERFEGTLEVRASAGEVFLGGEDFTRTLAARVLESVGLVFERAELEMPLLVSRVVMECERAKRRLASEETAEVRVPNAKGEFTEQDRRVAVTRREFDEWTEKLLARTDVPLRQALGDAQLRRTDISDVLLVGGATRMPGVRKRMAQLFGKEPQCRLNPDEAVALGAAIQAGLVARNASVADVVVTDVAPFTLGIEISQEVGGTHKPGYFMPIIPRNTVIPVSRSKDVSTLRANQPSVSVEIYQGESRLVKDNVSLGKFVVEGIPAGPRGQLVNVRFTYDLNGVLEVEATVVATGAKKRHVVTRLAGGLSAKELQKALDKMQELKASPREEAAYRHLMRWADRVYRELPWNERELLEELVRGFEDVVELQDKDAISRYEEALRTFLEARGSSFLEPDDELDDGENDGDEEPARG